MLIIAGIFIIGADWTNDTIHRLFHSYFADIALPFGFYFLIALNENNFAFLKKWYVKVGAVFTLCALSETLQYFGIFALARVFDLMDYVMYAIGVILAVFFDKIIFKRIFNFWK